VDTRTGEVAAARHLEALQRYRARRSNTDTMPRSRMLSTAA
jgi:hypothetical protein